MLYMFWTFWTRQTAKPTLSLDSAALKMEQTKRKKVVATVQLVFRKI